MSDEEVAKQLKEAVKAKMAELNFAEYQGDIKGFATILVNKSGQIQTMQAFDSNQAPHIYTALGLLQRQIEGMLSINATTLKPRD